MASKKGNKKGKENPRKERLPTPLVKKSVTPVPLAFEFSFVQPYCVDNRLINCWIDKVDSCLHIVEFSLNGSIIREDEVVLPGKIINNRILGKPLCVGCRSNLYIFQAATANNKYIQFFSVDTSTKIVKVFEDTTKYFPRTLVRLAPVECLISQDMETILLRLPQEVLRPYSFSNILTVLNISKPESDTCSVVTTKFLDRRLSCVQFYPTSPHILIVHIDVFCLKCVLQKYDLTNQTMTGYENHCMNDLNSSSIDDESSSDNQALSLDQTALDFDRTAELALFSCFPKEQSFMLLYGFDPLSLSMTCSLRVNVNLQHDQKLLISTEVSICNSKLNVFKSQKEPYDKKSVASISLPVCINLKSQVRSRILQEFTGKGLEHVMNSLPRPLQSYLNYNRSS